MMLDVYGLSHAYGRHQALDQVSIRVRAGEAVAILGANGAGKTTLLNAIAGLVGPAGGSIRFDGRELTGLSPHRIVELGIATVPENRRLFEPMSVIENLNLGAYSARARNGAAAALERIFDLFPRLAERRRQAVRTMPRPLRTTARSRDIRDGISGSSRNGSRPARRADRPRPRLVRPRQTADTIRQMPGPLHRPSLR